MTRASPPTLFAAAALLAPSAVLAQQAPDVAKYDCTRSDDGRSVPGDQLLAQGFEIASQGRFGTPNIMLVEPKSKTRANCFVRPEGQK